MEIKGSDNYMVTTLGLCVKGPLGPLHIWDWELVTKALQALSFMEKAEPVQVHFTLRLRDQRSMLMQDGCKVYMDSYMASNGTCFMVTWTTFKDHLLEVALTQNRESMTLWTLTTIALYYFIMCEDPHEQKFVEIAFGWGPDHIWLHTRLESPWPHYMILEVSLDSLWTLSFGLSEFMVTALGLCVWKGP
jgi:hypothetical protein